MQTLIFSVGQGWSSDLDVVYSLTRDLVAVSNIAQALAPLLKKFRVCVGITPCNSDREALWTVMGTFASYGISTVLDAISSDVFTIGKGLSGRANWRCPWLMAHGCAIAVWELEDMHTRAGSLIYGCRFHEVDTLGWIAKYRPAWLPKNCRNLTPYRYFRQQEYLEPIVSYCHSQGMVVIKSEPVLPAMGNPEPELAEGEQITRNLMQAYPGTVYTGYADNVSAVLPPACYRFLWPTMTAGCAGWCYSHQPQWYKNNPSVSDVVDPFVRAVRDGCPIVQIEPAWTCFNLPWGTMSDISEALWINQPQWASSGPTPRGTLTAVGKALATALMAT